MRVVSVTTMIPTKSGFAWWPCEVDVDPRLSDDEAMTEIMDALVEDGLLHVIKLDLDHLDGRRKKIVKRTPSVLGINMIGTITPLHVELVDA